MQGQNSIRRSRQGQIDAARENAVTKKEELIDTYDDKLGGSI